MRVSLLGAAVDEEVAARCQVIVEGTGDDAALVSSLLCSEIPADGRFEPVLLTPGALAPEMTVDMHVVAHLTSTNARLTDVWPSRSYRSAAEIYDAIDSAMPPHLASFGGSGLGKTTLFENLIARSVAAGNTTVVLDPHGDLASRQAALLAASGVDALVYDFGADNPPTLNICEPPPGYTVEEWPGELAHFIPSAWQNAADEDMPKEVFGGPVGRNGLRLPFEVLVQDPAGPHKVGDFASVVTEPEHWRAALERIGNPSLTAELNRLRRAVANDKDGHFGPWLFSKLEPILGNYNVSRP